MRRLYHHLFYGLFAFALYLSIGCNKSTEVEKAPEAVDAIVYITETGGKVSPIELSVFAGK